MSKHKNVLSKTLYASMNSNDLPELEQKSAVSSSPFKLMNEQLKNAAETANAKESVTRQNTIGIPGLSIKSNPFIAQQIRKRIPIDVVKMDNNAQKDLPIANGRAKPIVTAESAQIVRTAPQHDDISTNMQGNVQATFCPSVSNNIFNKTKSKDQLNETVPQTKCDNVISSKKATQNQTGDSRVSMLEILRNFDLKSKKEEVLYSSEPRLVTRTLNKSTGVKLLVKDPKPTIETSIMPVELESPVKLTRSMSVSERLKKFQPETPQKRFDDKVKSFQHIDPKMFVTESKKELPIVQTAGQSVSERAKGYVEEPPIGSSKLSRAKSISDRLKKFQKDDVPAIPVASFGSARSAGFVKSKLSTEITKQISIKPPVTVMPVSESFENSEQKTVSHLILQVENSCHGNVETEMENKRSDSGAFVESMDDVSQVAGINLAVVAINQMPKIDIGSIFDDNDGWVGSMMSNSSPADHLTFATEGAQEITPDYVIEREVDPSLQEPEQPTAVLDVVPETSLQPKRVDVPKRKSVSFAVSIIDLDRLGWLSCHKENHQLFRIC